jgi:hypothetical protein
MWNIHIEMFCKTECSHCKLQAYSIHMFTEVNCCVLSFRVAAGRRAEM